MELLDVQNQLRMLHNYLREKILEARNADHKGSLSKVAIQSSSDTIYQIDALTETWILDWFDQNWPSDSPIQLVMEGLETETIVPRHSDRNPKFICIIDPIDGTRNLMYDKRSAWILTGIAPFKTGKWPTLQDVELSIMTEVPPSKQLLSDQLSAIRGKGVQCQRYHLENQTNQAVQFTPSTATDCRHGFASIVKFFPDALSLTAEIEEALWDSLYPEKQNNAPLVFTDQYISTGGQLYELISGHDRMIADLRSIFYKALKLENPLACHPYDLAGIVVATEMGIIVEDPITQNPISAPLDTTTPVSWIGYANSILANHIRPHLRKALSEISHP